MARVVAPTRPLPSPSAWRVLRAATVDLLLGLVAGLGTMVAAMAAIESFRAGPFRLDAPDALDLTAMALATAVAAVVPYLRRRATGAEILQANRALLRASTWGWVLATTAAVMACAHALDWFDRHVIELVPANEEMIIGLVATQPVLTAIEVVVLAPIFEELLFRRVLFGRFLAAGRPWLGYVVSGVLFASMHEFAGLSQGGWLQTTLLWSFYFGMAGALAWVYRRTGSLWAPILVHMANNAIALWVLSAG